MKSSAEFLKESLLFRMSLGSKELYHSNVWAWLIENDPNFVKVFFPDFKEDIFYVSGVSREYKHRDIVVWLQKTDCEGSEGKYFYVIENKIKSLHRKEQLEEYTENLRENILLQGIFAGIENNLEEDQIQLKLKGAEKQIVWQFVDYATISRKIREFAQKSTNDIIRSRLPEIEEYCDIINAMYSVLNDALAENKGFVWYWGENNGDNVLSDLRIEDVYIKLQGACFIRYIESRREALEKLCPAGFRLEVGQSFHNGKATLDIRFTNWQDKNRDYLTIGVQIEGKQYRLLVQTNGKNGGKEVFEQFKGCWFDANFDCKQKERTIFGDKKTSMRKLFDSYGEGSGEYIFVYQYYNLTKENSRHEKLYEAIENDLLKARELFDRINCQHRMFDNLDEKQIVF